MAAAVALAIPSLSHGLGLGRIVGEPVLGESLLLEVPVTGTIERPLDPECITVRRPPDSIDAEYFPRDIVARLDRQSSSPRVVLTTRSAIQQPIVEFRVSVTCGYNLSSDYLLMASPRRDTVSKPVAAGAAGGAATRGEAPASSAVGRAQIAATPSPATAPASGDASLPDGVPGRTIILDRNMTLEQLARKHFPGPLRQGRFMRWVAEANPQAFADAKQLRQHKLQAGQQLVIPDGIPPRRPGDYKNGLTPLGEPMPSASPEAAPSRRQPQAAIDERVAPRSSGDGRKDRLVVGSGGGTTRDAKETVALVERLTGMMEQQLATQSANDEKIKQLEGTIADLGQTIARMEKEAAEREARWKAERLAEKQAEKAARESEAERGWWQLLMAVAVGGILGAGVLQGFRVLSGRRQAGTEAMDAAPPARAAAEAKKVAEADKSPQPLTEFGWNDEPPGKPLAQSGALPATRPAQPRTAAATTKGTPSAANADAGLQSRPSRASEPAGIKFEPPPPAETEFPNDPAKAAIELANIMASMGLTDSAAQTLAEHIGENPRQSLGQWLKLLDMYRRSGKRAEFDQYAQEMRQHFNVQPESWEQDAALGRASLEDFPHIRSQIVRLWRKPEVVQLLQALLLDNRGGTRAGFPLAVAEEILLLTAMMEDGSS